MFVVQNNFSKKLSFISIIKVRDGREVEVKGKGTVVLPVKLNNEVLRQEHEVSEYHFFNKNK